MLRLLITFTLVLFGAAVSAQDKSCEDGDECCQSGKQVTQIQKTQFKLKKDSNKNLFDLQKDYDQKYAELVLLKGIDKVAEDFKRSAHALRPKDKEVSKHLENYSLQLNQLGEHLNHFQNFAVTDGLFSDVIPQLGSEKLSLKKIKDACVAGEKAGIKNCPDIFLKKELPEKIEKLIKGFAQAYNHSRRDSDSIDTKEMSQFLKKDLELKNKEKLYGSSDLAIKSYTEIQSSKELIKDYSDYINCLQDENSKETCKNEIEEDKVDNFLSEIDDIKSQLPQKTSPKESSNYEIYQASVDASSLPDISNSTTEHTLKELTSALFREDPNDQPKKNFLGYIQDRSNYLLDRGFQTSSLDDYFQTERNSKSQARKSMNKLNEMARTYGGDEFQNLLSLCENCPSGIHVDNPKLRNFIEKTERNRRPWIRSLKDQLNILEGRIKRIKRSSDYKNLEKLKRYFAIKNLDTCEDDKKEKTEIINSNCPDLQGDFSELHNFINDNHQVMATFEEELDSSKLPSDDKKEGIRDLLKNVDKNCKRLSKNVRKKLSVTCSQVSQDKKQANEATVYEAIKEKRKTHYYDHETGKYNKKESLWPTVGEAGAEAFTELVPFGINTWGMNQRSDMLYQQAINNKTSQWMYRRAFESRNPFSQGNLFPYCQDAFCYNNQNVFFPGQFQSGEATGSGFNFQNDENNSSSGFNDF